MQYFGNVRCRGFGKATYRHFIGLLHTLYEVCHFHHRTILNQESDDRQLGLTLQNSIEAML